MRTSLRTIAVIAALLVGVPAAAQESLTINKIYTPAATDLTLAPTSDVVLNPTGKDVLPGNPYEVNLGALTRKYLTLHAAELWVETLVAQNTIATIGGRILVGPTTQLTTDVSTIDVAIRVKHNSLVVGDRVYLEADGKVEFMAITSGPVTGTGYFEYGVTRNLDGSGANLWSGGDAVFNTGQTGNGFIDLYSVRGVRAGTEIGPTIVGNVRTSSTYNAWSPRWAVGNLDGLYGYSGSTYGAAFGTPSGARVTIDSTSGITIYGGDNDPKVTIDTSGNATFDGSITVGTGRNQIRNADCTVSTSDWTGFTNTGLTLTLGGPWPVAGGAFALGAIDNDCYLTVAGTPAASTVSSMYGGGTAGGVSGFPVSAGLRYEASAYFGVHRSGNTATLIQWLDATPTVIATSIGNTCTASSAGGPTLVGYCRSGVVDTAPVGAVWARPVYQTTHTAQLNPFVFIVHTYFGEAGSAQEDLTPWGAAGMTEIINGLIRTDAIDARVIAANTITAAEIAAGTITAAQIQAGSVTADRLSVSTLSAITGNMGTLTAGTITGGTIDGATILAGSGDEVTLDASGISLATGTGAPNKIKWASGPTLSTPSAGAFLFLDGGLTVDKSINVTGTGAGAAAITISGGFGIAADTLISASMASSTGTPVIWETACGCLKKQTSSLRYKENVMPWSLPGARRLLNLTPIRFDYKGAGEKGVIGLSVEQLYLVAPEAVNVDAQGRPDSVRQDTLNVYLLELIKELRAELDELRRERKP